MRCHCGAVALGAPLAVLSAGDSAPADVTQPASGEKIIGALAPGSPSDLEQARSGMAEVIGRGCASPVAPLVCGAGAGAASPRRQWFLWVMLAVGVVRLASLLHAFVQAFATFFSGVSFVAGAQRESVTEPFSVLIARLATNQLPGHRLLPEFFACPSRRRSLDLATQGLGLSVHLIVPSALALGLLLSHPRPCLSPTSCFARPDPGLLALRLIAVGRRRPRRLLFFVRGTTLSPRAADQEGPDFAGVEDSGERFLHRASRYCGAESFNALV